MALAVEPLLSYAGLCTCTSTRTTMRGDTRPKPYRNDRDRPQESSSQVSHPDKSAELLEHWEANQRVRTEAHVRRNPAA